MKRSALSSVKNAPLQELSRFPKEKAAKAVTDSITEIGKKFRSLIAQLKGNPYEKSIREQCFSTRAELVPLLGDSKEFDSDFEELSLLVRIEETAAKTVGYAPKRKSNGSTPSGYQTFQEKGYVPNT